MDIEQIRTFLAVAANGSFLEAATRLHVTQSTVSTRIQNLEQFFGATLFVRNRSSATLTNDGRRLLRHAKAMLRSLDHARQEISLPSRYRGTLRIGARIALWEDFLPRFAGWLRRSAPDITLQTEIGFEEDLMRRLMEGSLDLGLMYTPQHSPGLEVEYLFDENLMLVAHRGDEEGGDVDPTEAGYIHVDWGPAFHQQHAAAFPEREAPALTANIGWLGAQLLLSNGGSCYLPERLARPLLANEQVFLVAEAPCFQLPAYMVFPRDTDSDVIPLAIQGLRQMVQ